MIKKKKTVSSFVPCAITQPFFELQIPDFAWNFIWTVPTNYEKKLKTKRPPETKWPSNIE